MTTAVTGAERAAIVESFTIKDKCAGCRAIVYTRPTTCSLGYKTERYQTAVGNLMRPAEACPKPKTDGQLRMARL